MDLLSSVLRDKELTSYLQEILSDGCELNISILNTINNYHKGRTSKNILFADLEAEWKFQKEIANDKTRNEVSDGGEVVVKKMDLTGQRFGRLVVVEKLKYSVYIDGKFHSGYLCKCDCGKNIDIPKSHLINGNRKSCGCGRGINSKNQRDKLVNEFHVEGTNLKLLNSKLRKNNTSGVTGVSWHKRSRRWVSTIYFQGKRIDLGSFKNKQDAINARKEAEIKYFKPILEKYK